MTRAVARRSLVLACVLAPLAARSQTVYRCEGPNGPSYSQTRCPDGGGKRLDVTDRRTPEEQARDRAAAEESAQRMRNTADSLEETRRAQEATAVTRASSLSPAPPPPPPPEPAPVVLSPRVRRRDPLLDPNGLPPRPRPPRPPRPPVEEPEQPPRRRIRLNPGG